MERKLLNLLALALIAATTCNAQNYNCYVCSGSSLTGDNGCLEGGFNSKSATVTGNCNFCSKSVSSAAGVTSVTRSCLPSCTASSVAGTSLYCCTSDKCNTGARLPANLPLVAGLVGMLVAVKYVIDVV